MPDQTSTSRILAAVAALERLDRRTALRLLREEQEKGPKSGNHWRSVAKLAAHIGEVDMALDAARRFAATEPRTLEGLLAVCSELARNGRAKEALAELDTLRPELQAEPAVFHIRGVIATQIGQFDQAVDYLHRALKIADLAPQSWFALAMVKNFTPGDPDLATMERLRLQLVGKSEPKIAAQYLYALGKAYGEIGEKDKSFACYVEGAALMRQVEPFDITARKAQVQRLITGFTPESLKRLKPSGCTSERVIFVNGLPRSGTTLVDSIINCHSAVRDGGEINLLQGSLIPAGECDLKDALAYQERPDSGDDPWGDIARDYLRLVDERFGPEGRVVDKTLSLARFMGLLMHILPAAKVLWLRRNPEDCALSCFRTFFTSTIPWSWSLTDIAQFFRTEDELYRHWTALFPDRILTVPYEELAADPKTWIPKILAHVNLDEETGVYEPHKHERSVMTASVIQVRQPISKSAIGKSAPHRDFMKPFRDAYYA